MKNTILHIIGTMVGRKSFFSLGKILQHVSHRMMGIGNYENEKISGEVFVVKHIRKIIKKENIVFFDVGAGQSGENSQLVRREFPKAKIFLFEPMPLTYKKLKSKFSNDKKMECHQLALSDRAGYLDLWDYKNKQTQHATIYKDHLQSITSKISKTRVEKKTIEEFIKLKRIAKIDFLKIDTEGQEYKIMSGAKEKLADISFIQFEFNIMNIFSNTTFKKIHALLSPNFSIYRIYQDGLLKINKYEAIYQEIYEFQNYLAINKKI